MGQKRLKIHQVDFSNDSMEFQWYPIVTIFNYERKVAESLKARFESMGASDKFGEVLVPIKEWNETVTSTKLKKDGTYSQRKVTKSENVFIAGYIFVKMVMDNHTWNIVRQTTGCAGYLKADGRPGPVEDYEIMAIKERLGVGAEAKAAAVMDFKGTIGDTVKIKTFNGAEAIIVEILSEKGFLKVITELGIKLEVEVQDVELVS